MSAARAALVAMCIAAAFPVSGAERPQITIGSKSFTESVILGELVALLPKDVNLDVGAMRVLRGKGDKARTVGLDATASALIERWVEVRSKLPGVQRSSPLFCTLQGRQLATVCIRQMLKRRALKANIDRRVHPHAFRHAHASELAREGIPLNLIADQLGHSNVTTTSIYLQHVAAADVIDAMRGRPQPRD